MPRGGARPGSGAKPKAPGVRRRTISLSLAPTTIALATAAAAEAGVSRAEWIERLILAELPGVCPVDKPVRAAPRCAGR